MPEKSGNKAAQWFSRACHLVSEARGSISEQFIDFLKANPGETRLYLVVGKARAGKSTILSELTGLEIGHTTNSGALHFEVYPSIIDGEQYLFVETAGFGAPDGADLETFKDILSCLFDLGPFVTLVGVICVYGEISNCFTRDHAMTLRWLLCFCGPEFMPNVVIALTNWDSYSLRRFKVYWLRVLDLVDKTAVGTILKHGGSLYHHGIPDGQGSHHLTGEIPERTLCIEEDRAERRTELQNLIRRQNNKKKLQKLQVLREAKTPASWKQTEAAKVLMAGVWETEVVIRNNRAVLVPKRDLAEPAVVSGPLPSADETNKKKGDDLKKLEETPKKSDAEPSTVHSEEKTIQSCISKPGSPKSDIGPSTSHPHENSIQDHESKSETPKSDIEPSIARPEDTTIQSHVSKSETSKSDIEPGTARSEETTIQNSTLKPEEQTGWGSWVTWLLDVASEVERFFREARSDDAAGSAGDGASLVR